VLFKICLAMADVGACLKHLCHRNAAQGNIEPIIHRHSALAEIEEEEDLESSYMPSKRTEPSLSYTATATSRTLSGSQLTLVQALAMAQELLRYQPTNGCREGWLAQITELVAIANKNPAQGARTCAGALDPPVGHQGQGAGHANGTPAKNAISRAA
jgi:hypothetical protein